MMFAQFPLVSVFEVTGQDSPRYLHARLTNEIAGLAIGQGCQAAALSAQGKTQGLFCVCRLDKSRFLLICSGGESERILAAVKQFIVADRVTVHDRSAEYKLFHFYTDCADFTRRVPSLSAYSPIFQQLEDDFSWHEIPGGLIVRRRRASMLGYDVLVSGDMAAKLAPEAIASGMPEADQSLRQLMRLQSARPDFPCEINETRLFSESGLAGAVSFNKGCYIGQEVISKLDATGKLPNVLVLLKLDGVASISPNTGVTLEAEAPSTPVSGKVLSCAPDPAGSITWCFAAMRNDPAVVPGAAVIAGQLPGQIKSLAPAITSDR